jgi:hypothetical protein
MFLEITKNSGKPHIILYKRDDGSQTWMRADDFFVRHDLTHYAIEKEMGYTTAFMGMLNKGMDIKDFEDRQKRNQMAISKKAWYSENMANLFLMEIAQGEFDNFNGVVNETFRSANKQYSPPVLSNEEIIRIRMHLRELLRARNELSPGIKMSFSIKL